MDEHFRPNLPGEFTFLYYCEAESPMSPIPGALLTNFRMGGYDRQPLSVRTLTEIIQFLEQQRDSHPDYEEKT
jgi:hypothetical protein